MFLILENCIKMFLFIKNFLFIINFRVFRKFLTKCHNFKELLQKFLDLKNINFCLKIIYKENKISF